MPPLDAYISDQALDQLLAVAQFEDLGPTNLDATSALFIDENTTAEAKVVARQPGTVAGLALLPAIIERYDPNVTLQSVALDGARVEPGDAVAVFSGSLRSVLMLERVALNFLGHLSGVATHTAAFADRIAHTSAKVYDTRKTLPGLRGLQKYAVACGGGGTHRMGLYDAVLVKDNHLAHVPIAEWTDALRAMADRARSEIEGLKFVMVEVDTLEQLAQVLPAGVDLVLLDNMPPDVLRQAVDMRNQTAPGVQLEASGGVTLDSVVAIAESGVDRISVGALTHSSINLDLGLDIEPVAS
ncbi:carboxylating nicotinate-nucleotide diphosphorylase [Algisphaera agarilytica]|uniref:Probable nicotinate-nucleotide pyrophosphorylase [carboxylating] n=1 Tax=Algisphaera agarilytica TaxID=1385975 RepID=A0A7X0H9G6_9BACT|nr:carboxylating nicotinate-nucleotide diphosphorylase [Algisphaera agarilytica]MBB6431734.1 nicotinate-nucleotide pyrophosphorylase (carboxylating) [Algisphaera agarilytica]